MNLKIETYSESWTYSSSWKPSSTLPFTILIGICFGPDPTRSEELSEDLSSSEINIDLIWSLSRMARSDLMSDIHLIWCKIIWQDLPWPDPNWFLPFASVSSRSTLFARIVLTSGRCPLHIIEVQPKYVHSRGCDGARCVVVVTAPANWADAM